MTNAENYSQLRNTWSDELLGTDRNSVSQHILSMTWDVAVFQIIVEAVGLASSDKSGIKLNDLLLTFLKKNFYTSFLVFTRRMVDNSKSANSLYRILDSMDRNSHYMTRENIFLAEKLEYDYSPIQQAEREWLKQQTERCVAVPQRFHWEFSADRHTQLDFLCDSSSTARTAKDVVSKRHLKNLKRRIGTAASDAKVHVDSFIAHSAKLATRIPKKADEISITFHQLLACHQAFCEVTSFLAIYLLGKSSGQWLAYPQYDQFRHIARPFVTSANVPKLKEKWDQLTHDSESWSNWGIEDYIKELSKDKVDSVQSSTETWAIRD